MKRSCKNDSSSPSDSSEGKRGRRFFASGQEYQTAFVGHTGTLEAIGASGDDSKMINESSLSNRTGSSQPEAQSESIFPQENQTRGNSGLIMLDDILRTHREISSSVLRAYDRNMHRQSYADTTSQGPSIEHYAAQQHTDAPQYTIASSHLTTTAAVSDQAVEPAGSNAFLEFSQSQVPSSSQYFAIEGQQFNSPGILDSYLQPYLGLQRFAIPTPPALEHRFHVSGLQYPPVNTSDLSQLQRSDDARSNVTDQLRDSSPLSTSQAAARVRPSQVVAAKRILIPLELSTDNDNLTEYQCLVRKQMLLFEATQEDIDSNAQGRNRPIVLGQVGVLCKHCVDVAPNARRRGTVYFPNKLEGFYQAGQNMAFNHFTNICQHMPEDLRSQLLALKAEKAPNTGGGRAYWANGARVLGVEQSEQRLVFSTSRQREQSVNPAKSSNR